MKTLVTGGAGFIGSHLVDALVSKGHDVVAVDNLSTGYLKNLESSKDKISFVEGNTGDEALMLKALEGVDVVYHEAALTSVPRSMENPMETFKETMAASVMILDCARRQGVKRFIYAASSSAYGNRQEEVKSEDLYPMPISPYAASKVSLEMFAKAYSDGFGMETVGLRYFNVFGPRQDPSSTYAAVIPIFMKNILSGQHPTITGDGNQSRDFTYVANVVEANILAMTADLPQKGNVLNVATGERITLPQLVESINVVAGTNLEAKFGEERPGDVRHSLADINMAKDILSYKPVMDFLSGLKITWDFAKGNW